jgi:hypothetical protein
MTKLKCFTMTVSGALVALGIGCSNENGVGGGTGGSSAAGGAPAATCDADPLHTGETSPAGSTRMTARSSPLRRGTASPTR